MKNACSMFCTLFLVCTGLLSTATFAEPLQITFVANIFSGTSQTEDQNIPAIVHKAVMLTEGQIKPSYKRMSDSRAWRRFLTDKDICLFNKIKSPERQRIANYTKYPKDIYPPQRLIVHPDTAEQLRGMSSLEEILNQTKLIIGIVGTNNYGTRIMPVIAKYTHRFYLLATAQDHEKTLLKMLHSKRIDGIFHSAGLEWGGYDSYTRISLEEADPAILGYIICPKSDIGQQAISLLDVAMATQEFRTFIVNVHLKTFHSSEHNFLQKQFESIYGNP